MSDQGFCPTCGIPWPNFCPIDGKRLSGPWTCANAPKPVIRQPVIPMPAAEAEPAPAPEPAPMPVAAPAPVAESAPAPAPHAPQRPVPSPLRRQPDANLQGFVDNVGNRAPIAKTRAPVRARASQDDARTAATLIQPQLTDEVIAEAKARAAERAAAPPAEPAEKKKRAKGEFSDTQWFMKGLNLQVADPDTGEVAVDEAEYLVDESISEDERRRFTLRKKHEE